MEEPKEFVRDYAMEKDIISIAKGNFDQEKYPEQLDVYKAYYKTLWRNERRDSYLRIFPTVISKANGRICFETDW